MGRSWRIGGEGKVDSEVAGIDDSGKCTAMTCLH